MSSPLNFALGVLGAAVAGSIVFTGSMDGALTKISSAERADTVSAANPPPKPGEYNPGATVIAADRDGHFHVDLRIEGRPVSAVVDTGASMVAISYEDAQRIGLYVPSNAPRGRASTANGIVSYSVVKLRDVRVNGITFYDVDGAVMPPGALRETLLGMSFLKRLNKFEMQRDRLVLAQ